MAGALVFLVLEQMESIRLKQAGARIWGDVAEEFERLENILRVNQPLIKDAVFTGRYWLNELKDALYDMDDLLYARNAAIHKRKMEEVNEISSKFSEKVSSFISSHFFCYRQASLDSGIARKIKYLNKTLGDIAEIVEMYFNFEIVEHRSEKERRMFTEYFDPCEICVRDHDKNEIVELLLSVGSVGQTLPVISIVGMGGIGKTTVAQSAYNDYKVQKHFDLTIWVHVSDSFDNIRVAEKILLSLGQDAQGLELENVWVRIHESIMGKKILLVLDDVWTEDYQKWKSFKLFFKPASLGSKILVTTRKENVVKIMEKTNMIQLGKLSHEESWSLFSQFAFYENKSDEECKKLEDIGKIILKKCDGFPLAIKALACLLRYHPTRVLETILDTDLWKLEEVDEVFKILLSSYYDLPPMLKRCFSYCAIFPKDYKITKDKLIKLWMAQGYLGGHERDDKVLIGEECFKNLEMRFFFQEFERSEYDGSIISCKMHNIMHDLARFLVNDEFYTIEIDDLAESEVEFYYKVRHLMIIGNSTSIDVHNNKKLRSLIVERTASDFKIRVDLSNYLTNCHV